MKPIQAFIILTTDEDGFPDKYLYWTLSNSTEEAWEKWLKTTIQKDIANQNRLPSDPFPLYWKARRSAESYGNKAVKVEINLIQEEKEHES